MRIFLDRYFTFFSHRKGWLEIELAEPAPLSEVLARLGIPVDEVQLVVVNSQAFEPEGLVVHPRDVVQIFPPFGGG